MIAKSGDGRFSTAISYQGDDNTHVFESIINAAINKGVSRISDVFS